MIYKIRVILDTEQDVFRDIEVEAQQNLVHLHQGIKHAFELEGEELASFFLSNDEWFQGSEIPLVDTSDDQSSETMDQIKIIDVLPKEGSKAIYVYDFLSMWTFFCEIVETDVVSTHSEFPAVAFEFGQRPDEAPEQSMTGEIDLDLDFEDDEEEDDDSYYDPDNYY